jgi:hypothetical protein
MPSKVDPVWILFRRRMFSLLAYWLLPLGYDMRDRSFSNRLYFIYFCVFWLAWAVATFAVLGSWLIALFVFLRINSPSSVLILFGACILAIWTFIGFWKVTTRSPFVFSESDAYLLCQTPVHRRSVGLAWFLMSWFGAVIPFAIGTVLFSFALTDITLAETGTVSIQSLPIYFASSLRSLAITLPLQMGLHSGMYGLGAMRLRRDRPPGRRFWLRLTALPLGGVLLAAFIFPGWRPIILAPLLVPLQAAFGYGIWLRGAGLALLIQLGGIANLLFWSSRMHLGRAAEETRLVSATRTARSAMNYELAENIRVQGKMKVTRPPSRIPVRNGVWMLVWKNLLQSLRSARASRVMRWVMAFALGVITFLPSSGWNVQMIMGGGWAILLGSLTTDHLRKDLARWWLLRSLPFQNSKLIASLLAPAWVGGVLLGWMALILVHPSSGWLIAAILPFLVASAALGSTLSILEHTKSRILMTPSLAEENVPHQGIQGVITILISVGLPLVLLILSNNQSGGLMLGLLSLLLSILSTSFLAKSVLRTYRWVS